jgi:hypothetical protein
MSLADLASIGSFISGFGVLISLIYLGLQVRQAKLHQQGTIRQGRATRIVELLCDLADPARTSACIRGNMGDAGISHTELQQFQFLCLAIFYHYEDEYFQHEEGLTNDAAFASFMKSAARVMAVLGLRVMWRQLRQDFIPEFVTFMDKIIAASPVEPAIDPLSLWQAGVAAELSKQAPA